LAPRVSKQTQQSGVVVPTRLIVERELFGTEVFDAPSHVVVLSRRSEGNTVARPQRALERSRDTPGALSRSTRFASRFWFGKRVKGERREREGVIDDDVLSSRCSSSF
jgi:hypothetical protein